MHRFFPSIHGCFRERNHPILEWCLARFLASLWLQTQQSSSGPLGPFQAEWGSLEISKNGGYIATSIDTSGEKVWKSQLLQWFPPGHCRVSTPHLATKFSPTSLKMLRWNRMKWHQYLIIGGFNGLYGETHWILTGSTPKNSCHGGRSQLGSAHLRDAHPRAADAHGHAAGGSPAITKRNWDSDDGSMLGDFTSETYVDNLIILDFTWFYHIKF